MSLIVARTCTEIEPGDGRVRLGESMPLSEFRSMPALVLLGDPGSGKTTEFEGERDALGDGARYLKARNFATLDIDSHPEWRDKVLFIDGLDEMRAGSGDGRVPLDEIRHRLDRLRPPSFRISCREADWLGHNDRESLDVVSPDGQVTVVRLDPLDAESIRELLGSLIPGDVEGFIEEALHRDVRPLLENPLTLKLLADAVQKGDDWPESRCETFEMACTELASERNPEHRIAAPPMSSQAVMDAAGYLCALQLLAGIDGYSLPPGPHGSSFVELDGLGSLPAHLSLDVLKQALSTRLFTVEGETAFVPIHRQVAEFLGGRYLAGLVEDGLPARRITALMTSPADGRVVTELRGISAWLAAHSREARRQLIDADPVGVGLYGDIGGFALSDKEHLLASLAAFARQGPLFGHEWRDGRNAGFRDGTAWAFRSLASADMVRAITNLVDPEDGGQPHDRVMEFVLNVLSEADTDLESLAALVPHLEAILNSPDRSAWVKKAALDAHLHVAPSGDAKIRQLRNLLDRFHDGILLDPDDELRGTLLLYLYPEDLPPSDVWRYVGPRNNHRFGGRFCLFWTHTIFQNSSNLHVALLLDALHDEDSETAQLLQESGFEHLPVRLLAQGLNAMGDEMEPCRLYSWLSATRPRIDWIRVPNDHTEDIRKWLESRPRVQKRIVLEWTAGNDPSDPSTFLDRSLTDVLHRSRLPSNFGLWCLNQAIAASGGEPTSAERLIELAYHSLRDPSASEGLSLERMHERLRGNEALEQRLAELHQRASSARDTHQYLVEERRQRHIEEEMKRRDDWARHLRTHESELRDNRYSPENLDKLGRVSFGWAGPERGLSETERIAGLIGDDHSLVDLVMNALRNAIRRDDLPEADLSLSLFSESRRPWLAIPVLASMYLLGHDSQGMASLDEDQKRRALTIYYCWGNVHPRPGSACRAAWFEEDPDLVLDVLHRCALASIRRGDETLAAIHDLDLSDGHGDLVQESRLRLLEAFPARIPEKQLRAFDHLLGKTLEQRVTTRLATIATKKLSLTSLSVSHRVRWMTVDAVLSEGSERTERLTTYLGKNERRVRHLAEFLRSTREGSAGLLRTLSRRPDPAMHLALIEVLGRSFGPCDLDGFVTLEMSTSELIGDLISRLRSMPDLKVQEGLIGLVAEPRLERWRDHLTRTTEQQRVVHSDASYRHPDIEQVQRTLDNRAPANAADLAAVLRDQLETVSDNIQGDSTNLWRQFWNEDSYGRPTEGKPEESCRDVLLEALKHRLPYGVDAAPEGRYAADRRADVRVSYGGFNIPIEIKKNSHRDLWSALRNQLIDRYTTDPATSGYGIYLVLWFGPDQTTRPPDGSRPTSPDDLRRVLESELTADEARKIAVIVIDVTKPGVPSTRIR